MRLRRMLSLALAGLLLMAAVTSGLAAQEDYNMPYYIEVDVTSQIVTVYSTASKVIVRQMLCSTGLKDATPTGTYTMPPREERLEREEWYYFRSYSCYAQYASRIYKGVLFHSIPCNRKSQNSVSKTALAQLGRPASHGCIRLLWQDAEFIAKCCLEGTRVRIFKGKHRNDDLRALLYAGSYTNEKGQTYNAFLGIPEDEEGALGRNSEGKEVVNLQTRLRDLGFYDGEIDGKYEGPTICAVREAQRLMGQEETGIANAQFQAAIMDDANAPTAQNVPVKEGMSGPVVRIVQQHLKTLGLYDGDMDGVFDVDVADAAKKFQGAYGYPNDAVLTPEIQKALHYEAGKVASIFGESAGYTCEITPGQVVMAKIDADTSIRLREKPTAGSSALARLAVGDLVVALEHGDTYSKVQRRRDIGYINNAFLAFYQEDIYELKYTATDGDLTYTIGNTERSYQSGAKVPCEVFEDYLASGGSLDDYDDGAPTARVRTESSDVSLNLREGPNTASAILAELPNDTEVNVLLRSSEWSLVEWQGLNGYLLNQYLAFEEEAEEEVSEEDADTAELPAMVIPLDGGSAPVFDVDSEDATELGRLKTGTHLTVIETVEGWSHIRYQGHEGYMRDIDLQFLLADEVTT